MRWNLALAGLAASWGFIAVLAASVELGAEALAFWRLGLATVTLGLVALLAGHVRLLAPRGRLGALALLGVVQAAHWVLFFEAVEHGSVALAVLTFYAAPLVIALAAPVFLGERSSAVVLAACVVGAVGIAAIALDGGSGSGASAAAVAAGLGSAATYAALVLLAKRLVAAALPPLTVAFWDCLAGTVAVAPVLLLAERVLPAGPGEWVVALALGIAFTGASTLVYTTLLRRVTAQAAGVLTFLEPVAGVLLGWALLEQQPGGVTLLGGALVLAAGVAVVLLEPSAAGIADAPAGVASSVR